MSTSEFRFPVNYNFPPFYTRQPTEATWQNQVAQWSEFIQSYCRHHRIFRIDLHEATVPGASELFENSRIKRRLSFETLQEIIDEMVQQGVAEWEGGNKGPKTHAVIYWRKPDDWANLILQWVTETGNNNNILTVHEIAHGELVEDQPFYQLDGLILDKALHILSKRGVAQLFKGSGDDESMGVKFFAP
ncbi:ESCRT-II complex subunit-domain-containing protein [Syncephalastrum racemosum]|uniref:Vacuolar protein-sorting-associated protein 25 n=1 Tax=Syncephalastrum racemosum TaxID=13706 RepID=A0A1X2HIK4_SYNRA|nr:ESCRT-II complex subunit-domain-containing protein [Syncephalastrum racemosum]